MSLRETAFTMDTSSIKYGAGTSREVGFDMVVSSNTCLNSRASIDDLKQLFRDAMRYW